MKVCVLVDGYAQEPEYDAPPTAQQLLADLALDDGQYWVARNRKMMRKDDLSRTTVDDGDVIEIYRIISGG
jgi:thiamine biosynthesis protein ThiS